MENEDIAKSAASMMMGFAQGLTEDNKHLGEEAKSAVKNKSLSAAKDTVKKAVSKAVDAKTAAADKVDRSVTNAAKAATHAAGAVVPGGKVVAKAADKAQDAAYKARSAARKEIGEIEKSAAGAGGEKRFSLDDKLKSMVKNKSMAIVTGNGIAKGAKSLTDLVK